ncbi:aldehyde dehydrogenase family protein [Microbacterium sp.]|uniref:aldehyde dehydrogenase family protein n=1 Tax=Microbacterium sp. TaxID=51671 RepID=UPI0039E42DAA
MTVATFPDLSPIDGALVGEFPALCPEDAIDRVRVASEAQPDWARRPFAQRRRILLDAADLLEAEVEDHVALLAREIGATRPWAEMNVHESAATLREAAAVVSGPTGEILPSADPGTRNHSLRVPVGVSLSIVPWNAPVILAARSSAISLALGNAVIIRPSEEAPIAAGHLLADALVRSGVPSEVLPVVTSAPGEGRHLIDALVQDERVRRVAFIGSTPVGRAIAARAGAALTPSVMELGGKNVTIVRGDADLARWTGPLAFSAFANSGQVCMCTDRLLVHRSRYEELCERMADAARGMVVGDPRNAGTDLGPLINDRAAAHFTELVEDARRGGAKILAGGTSDGRWAQPTVLTDVGDSCRFAVEEGFAPIVSIEAFDSDDDAVRRANAGELGLIAAVISADHSAAERLAHLLRAGAVHVNGPSVGDEPHVPFGGLAASGMGRLGGWESVRFFTEQRSLYLHGAAAAAQVS